MPRMSGELLARCSGQAKRRREESVDEFLGRVTHLYCAEKCIETIEGLSLCRNLSVLYLYDNLLRGISGLSSCPLTHLYLQNNHITTVQGLATLHRLSKLYLSGNAITVVEGLEGLASLSELHIAHQRLPEGEKLLFDPRSLQAIAPTLTVLNVSGNGLDSIEELKCLRALTHLSAMENSLANMKSLSGVFGQWPQLWRVDLTGNPVCAKVKYRDRIITMATCIGVVDGREVNETEREFLLSWKAVRRVRRKHQRAARLTGGLINEGGNPPISKPHPPLPPPPPPTLTLPALPARYPPKFKTDSRTKREASLSLHSPTKRLPDLIPTGYQTTPSDHPDHQRHKIKPGGDSTYHDITHGSHISGRGQPGFVKGGFGYSESRGYGDLSALKEHSSVAWRPIAVADRRVM